MFCLHVWSTWGIWQLCSFRLLRHKPWFLSSVLLATFYPKTLRDDVRSHLLLTQFYQWKCSTWYCCTSKHLYADWPHEANWIPLKNIALGPDTKTFSSAGHPVQPLYAALLAARVHNLRGQPYTLKMCAHILPTTPIPFLYGLVAQRSLGFNLCLRVGNASYLNITDKNNSATIPRIVSSHVWLRFQPVIKISHDDPERQNAIACSLESTPVLNSFAQLLYIWTKRY